MRSSSAIQVQDSSARNSSAQVPLEIVNHVPACSERELFFTFQGVFNSDCADIG